jgi:hypothetical protein
MKHAVDIAVADGYAVMGQIGYRTIGFERGLVNFRSIRLALLKKLPSPKTKAHFGNHPDPLKCRRFYIDAPQVAHEVIFI